MDHATLTDNNGRKADFRNVILVMTTNAGAQELARAMIGFGAGVTTGSPRAMIDRMFSPEFRNRLSAIIEFSPLPPAVIERVVDKFLLELSERLEANKVTMEVTPAAKKWLAERGYDTRFGARPLGRLIENEIARVLADDVLFGRLTKGGRWWSISMATSSRSPIQRRRPPSLRRPRRRRTSAPKPERVNPALAVSVSRRRRFDSDANALRGLRRGLCGHRVAAAGDAVARRMRVIQVRMVEVVVQAA